MGVASLPAGPGHPLAAFAAFRDAGQIDWIQRPSLLTVAGAVMKLSGGTWLLLLAYGALCLLGLAHAVRYWRANRVSSGVWRHALVVVWLVVPFAASLGISLVKPIFHYRYLSLSLPALVVLAAAGATQLRPPAVFAGAMGLVTVLASFSLGEHYRAPAIEDWRNATEYQRGPTDRNESMVHTSRRSTAPRSAKPGGSQCMPTGT